MIRESGALVVDGAVVQYRVLPANGSGYRAYAETGAWLVGRTAYGTCACCSARPCDDGCPVQVTPDWLVTKAKRSGLTVEEWLARYEREYGRSWLDVYPHHPAAIGWRAERARNGVGPLRDIMTEAEAGEKPAGKGGR